MLDLETWNWGWFVVGLVLAVLVIVGALALNGAFDNTPDEHHKGTQLPQEPDTVTATKRKLFAEAHSATPTPRPPSDHHNRHRRH